jgi:hypothetical protein
MTTKNKSKTDALVALANSSNNEEEADDTVSVSVSVSVTDDIPSFGPSNSLFDKIQKISSFNINADAVPWRGKLYKKGKLNTAWKSRFFVLNEQQQRLYYYPSEQAYDACLNSMMKKNSDTNDANSTDTNSTNSNNTNSNTNTNHNSNSNNSSNNTNTVLQLNETTMLGFIDLTDVLKIKITNDNGLFFTHKVPQYLILKTKKKKKSKKSQENYTFELVCDYRTWVLHALDGTLYLKWLKHLQMCCYGKVLHEGYIWKYRHKKWKKRYFVLNEWYYIRYYQQSDREKYLGCIKLEEVQQIESLEQAMMKYSNILEMSTPKRIWILGFEDAQERV